MYIGKLEREENFTNNGKGKIKKLRNVLVFIRF